ncbi:predicted protein [Sclerotinia sclerotiorum 1980 UF-70]|uniref:Uncharacterized protein n=1 Tax=Sclerotinia sclerotiorum (strain ATCC 18683 / 1980 / Ss-1) TaxID=665079 RepID=A7F7N3_SCLS1|nr:predicted protein [Sclerotinia sclerotiorum 1980 UF-70]EDN98754.1 predicted protein [Sclerotinia sclerotiorum 1980 UF-70]
MDSRLQPVGEQSVMFSDPFDSQSMGSPLKKSTTNTSSHLDSPFDDYEQDWKTVTHERDSWATRERRRSTPFANISNAAFMGSHHEAKHGRSGSSTQPRKGSILSVWSDPNGDEEPDDLLVRVSSRKSEDPRSGRRGSVLRGINVDRKEYLFGLLYMATYDTWAGPVVWGIGTMMSHEFYIYKLYY